MWRMLDQQGDQHNNVVRMAQEHQRLLLQAEDNQRNVALYIDRFAKELREFRIAFAEMSVERPQQNRVLPRPTALFHLQPPPPSARPLASSSASSSASSTNMNMDTHTALSPPLLPQSTSVTITDEIRREWVSQQAFPPVQSSTCASSDAMHAMQDIPLNDFTSCNKSFQATENDEYI